MSRNGSGTYTLPSGNPVVSGTLIESAWANNTLSDIATALTDSLSRSGQGSMTAAFRAFDGTSTVPGIAWGSETTTGWYRAGAADMRLVVTGSEVMKYLSTGVSITGTLSGSGNFAINTDKFTVAASSGNTVVAGTLGVTGAMTLTANPTLSAGTANGVLYLNGSKAATSGSALTFDGTNLGIGTSSPATKLDVRGELSVPSSTYSIRFYNTDRNNWSYISNTIGASSSDSNLVLGSGFGAVMTLDGNGRVGIGTSSPATKLQVYGGALTVGDEATYAARFSNNSNKGVVIGYDTTNNVGHIGSVNPAVAWTDLVLNKNGGNLGLGVTPSAWESGAKVMQFSTAGAGGTTGNTASIWARNDSIRLINGGYFDGAYKYSATGVGAAWFGIIGNSYQWNIAPSGTAGNAITFTQAMTLDASGILTLENDQLIRNGKGLALYNSGNTGYWSMYNSSDAMIFSNGSEKARFDSSGNLLVGVASTVNSSKMFMAFSGGRGFGINDAGGGSGTQVVWFQSAGTQVGSITTNSTSTSYNTSSDYRLKENIQPMTGALAKVAALKPCTYNWKADGSDGEGFIAHELAEVVPQCVTGEKDAVDADGKPVYQGIDTSFLVATLTAAIQEQQAIIEQLKADVAALKAKA